MAARKPPTNRRASPADDERTPDIQELFKLHLEASQHRKRLLDEAIDLRTQRKFREAAEKEAHAHEIRQRLEALENEVKPPGGHRRDKRFTND
jgi:hypothetical protein